MASHLTESINQSHDHGLQRSCMVLQGLSTITLLSKPLLSLSLLLIDSSAATLTSLPFLEQAKYTQLLQISHLIILVPKLSFPRTQESSLPCFLQVSANMVSYQRPFLVKATYPSLAFPTPPTHFIFFFLFGIYNLLMNYIFFFIFKLFHKQNLTLLSAENLPVC